MTMPDRIFADAPSIFDGSDVWHSEPSKGRTEYIRADAVRKMIEEATKGAYEEGYGDGRDPGGYGL
jgi:hypothetical protein